MKKHLSALLVIAFAPWLSASEIYFADLTPEEVASNHSVQPPQVSADGQIVLEAVFGIAVAGPPPENDGILSSVDGEIRLARAAISPTTASGAGYPTYRQDALDAALVTIEGSGIAPARTPGAAEYRYGLGQNGSTSLWDIQFEGVPDYDPADQNFFPDQLDEAVAAARTAIRANPFQKGPGSGYAMLFQTAYEATVPYTFAGNEWRAKAERDRLGVTPGLDSPAARMSSLNTAAQRFQQASEALLELVNHPVESAWLLDPDAVIEGAGPAWAEGDSWADLLYESYAEALVRFADARFEFFYTRYLSEYQAPGSGNTAMQQLIKDIEDAAAEIDQLVLPLAALSTRGVLDPEIDVHGPSSRSSLMRRLAEHVQDRSLFFSAGVNPVTNRFGHSTYAHNFVPFLVPAQLETLPFTFDNLFADVYGLSSDGGVAVFPAKPDPGTLIDSSIEAETIAQAAIDDVIENTTDLGMIQAETQDEYRSQLGQLCGWRLSDQDDIDSEPVPDILGYLAPPEFRDPLLTNESYGDIALAWSKIEQAETRVQAAYRELKEIAESAEIIKEFGRERLESFDRIANIQLKSGEEISALDYLSGEIRAQAIKAAAEERAIQAEKKNWFAAVASVVIRAGLAYVTAGASETLTAAQAAAQATKQTWSAVGTASAGALNLWQEGSNSKSQAEMHRKIGAIQANAARRQAKINAQRTQIRAVEAADITIEQATQEDARIRERIHQLMIGVERKKLEILLAKQAQDYAEIEHANMIARIGNLLEEYRRVTIRQANSTLNRPDVRLVRDYKISEANRLFRIAKEYSFLLCRAAEYRFAGTTASDFVDQIVAVQTDVLAAQNATQLQGHVETLIGIRSDFFDSTGGMSDMRQIRFSLRDYIAQSNASDAGTLRDLDGEPLDSSDGSIIEMLGERLQPFPGADPNDPQTVVTISDQQFADYLESHLEDPDGTGDTTLVIPFSTGFEPSFGGRANPLRLGTVSEYGHVIEGHGPSYVHRHSAGVFVNIRLSRQTTPQALNAFLRAKGTFYTTRGALNVSDQPLPEEAVIPWNFDGPWNVINKGSGNFALEVRKTPLVVVYNQNTVPVNNVWKNSISGLDVASQGSLLHERSPANDYWELSIQIPGTFREKLAYVRDIEVCMTIRGWAN